ncbi:putative membrane protein, required for N-linked glycosylation [Xenococcus sp. PCC 7305]|uniref:Ycf66 family protein n=1 Tax=Xenococcus sp. PCC 7305 TaxID=102125 RepID=UPI0002ACDF3B|nr:Ycf66 family protein [Xenococcus sp. PCC 7305]ELS03399.1 putative membrane protein, required for N-linked glycosylation [Xenococcus sp. PCC 7305]
MVNFGLNAASILGIFLAVAGASLYFLRSVRPELSRDHDIFFAAIGLLCGFIMIFQGWRLDPILQFGQLLLTGSAIFFAVESIRLRAVATEQARRNTPTVDRDRPVSRTRVYREEDSERTIPESYGYENARPNYDSPRLRGYEDPEPRPTRRTSMRSESRSRGRDPVNNRAQQYNAGNGPRPRLTKKPAPSRDRYDEWNQPDSWDEPNYSPPSRPVPEGDRYSDDYSRPESPRRPSNKEDFSRSYQNPEEPRNYDDGLGRSYDDGLGRGYEDEEEITTDYVDYQPLDSKDVDYSSDYPEDERDYNEEDPGARGYERRSPRNPEIRNDFEY